MRKVVGPIVGLSFTEDHIQAVAVRPLPNGGGVEVTQVASAPMPDAAMDGGIITDRMRLAAAIRQMLHTHQITAKQAVVGLPSRAVFARTVTIPPVPDAERRAVVRGEIDHLNILPPGQGTFDYVVFARPTGAGASSGSSVPIPDPLAATSGKGEPVLFFAAEQHVAQDYWAVANDAGLHVIGLEPSEYAAIRTVYPNLASRSLALAISVGANNTHLQFLRGGYPVYARRLDVGIQQMSVPEVAVSATGEAGGWRMYGETEEAEAQAARAATGAFTPMAEKVAETMFVDKSGRANAARQRLAQEIGRSIEYFGREYVADLTALSTVLLPNDLNLAGLPIYVTAALEQEVDFSNAFENVQVPAGLEGRLLQEEGVAFAPALGLALGPVGGKFAGLPVFDLSLEAAAATRVKEAPKVLVGAFAAAAGVLAAGAVFAFIYAQKDIPVREALASEQQKLSLLTTQESALKASISEQEVLVRQIQSKNLPWTNVLRHLSVAVPPGMGLTTVAAQGTTITIGGETKNPDWIPAFWSRMNASGFFTGANVTSITRNDDKVAFQMTATLPAPVVPAPQTAATEGNTTGIAAGVAAANNVAEKTLERAPAGAAAPGGTR
jgi:Tfp pilus assembly PilM family ATPase/Tfp pilus assembly protein PilN